MAAVSVLADYLLSGNANAAKCGYSAGAQFFTLFLGSTDWGKTVNSKKQRKISVVHSGPAIDLNAGTRKCRRTDRHSQYRPWRRIQGVSTASLPHTHDVASDSDHASRHAPLRARLWFRLFDAYADFRAGMRPQSVVACVYLRGLP